MHILSLKNQELIDANLMWKPSLHKAAVITEQNKTWEILFYELWMFGLFLPLVVKLKMILQNSLKLGLRSFCLHQWLRWNNWGKSWSSDASATEEVTEWSWWVCMEWGLEPAKRWFCGVHVCKHTSLNVLVWLVHNWTTKKQFKVELILAAVEPQCKKNLTHLSFANS